jgi:hypothetical protein
LTEETVGDEVGQSTIIERTEMLGSQNLIGIESPIVPILIL